MFFQIPNQLIRQKFKLRKMLYNKCSLRSFLDKQESSIIRFANMWGHSQNFLVSFYDPNFGQKMIPLAKLFCNNRKIVQLVNWQIYMMDSAEINTFMVYHFSSHQS
jgi:hypothetical protein